MQVSEIQGLDELNKTVKQIIKGVSSAELNVSRANTFTGYTKQQTKLGSLGLKENRPATRKIQGESHPPLSWKSRLISKMKVKKNKDKSADAGYFDSDKSKPEGKNISFTKIAKLQSTGYRIPLAGAKGQKVRGFLAKHGIFPKKTKNFLIVKPRPFVYNCLYKYEERGKDNKAINKHMDRLWGKL